ncbi:MAG: hypothetical protein RIK87_13015 [Fuerstiella sp.]
MNQSFAWHCLRPDTVRLWLNRGRQRGHGMFAVRRYLGGFCLLLLILTIGPASSSAQYVNPAVARWAVADQVYRGRWYSPVQYGASGYSYYPRGVQTARGNAIRAQAAMVMARAKARKDAAAAAVANQKAQAQYLENKARYDEMRRWQRDVAEAREAKEDAARRERAANWQKKSVTALYGRLSVDQLDWTTGEIFWPDSLAGSDFDEDRTRIQEAVRFMAQNGPDQRSAKIINEVAQQMKQTAAKVVVSKSGFQTYTEARKFLDNLSVEGFHAMEEL